MRHHARSRAALPGFESESDERVLEDLEVLLHRPDGELSIPADRREVDEVAALRSHHVQEARESSEVAHERFRMNLLLEVDPGICAQELGRGSIVRRRDCRKTSELQDSVEIE